MEETQPSLLDHRELQQVRGQRSANRGKEVPQRNQNVWSQNTRRPAGMKSEGRRQQARGPEDPRTQGPEDTRTRGHKDPRTRVHEDPRTQGPKDQSTRGPEDTRTQGPEDPRTQGHKDPRTQRPKDPRTRRPEDPRTQGPEDQSVASVPGVWKLMRLISTGSVGWCGAMSALFSRHLVRGSASFLLRLQDGQRAE
ncbi:hypothetical protein EYF80_066218 [Liparis tanakae]|uniref:Uncharacterized protein n=1 Tax=Liparis tanakae TaxID=230148 RepID=A0A4Z2E503_9TELE|nr:hypothetical protein EYF80_066218 [Liparis tanakae]